MPRIGEDLETHALPTGSFGYSAARMDDLGATEYTLVTLVVDTSGSVAAFKPEMESCIREVVQACKLSPRADNLMVRLVTFADSMDEFHGYKLLEQCNLDDYQNCLVVGGVTALFDASENAILASSDYAQKLVDNDFQVNGIVVIVTDGCDNDSAGTADSVQAALAGALKSEVLKSLVSILIGVNIQDPQVSAELKAFNQHAGISRYEEIAKADAKTLAKLAEFISKSISAQSQALGTGGASQPVSLNI